MALVVVVLGAINLTQLAGFQQCCQKDCGAGTQESWTHRPISGVGACVCHVTVCSTIVSDGEYDDCFGHQSCDSSINDVLDNSDPTDCSENHEYFANDHGCYYE